MKNIFLAVFGMVFSLALNSQTLKVYKKGAVLKEYSSEVIDSVVFVETTDPHEYVDLGLPSGTLWATCNVGADKPEDYGLYFAWAETAGYSSATSEDHSFDWAHYKWMTASHSSENQINRYTVNDGHTDGIWYVYYSYYTFVGDGKSYLDQRDDVAIANWGRNWCMPTDVQQLELLNSKYVTATWTCQNGVFGQIITSNTNGNNIFLPAAGYCNENGFVGVGSDGYYWSKKLYNSINATVNRFNNGAFVTDNCCRCYGLSVRPVRSAKND